MPQNFDRSSTSILSGPDADRRLDSIESTLDIVGGDHRSYELERLRPSTIYSVVIHPLHRKSVEGPASNIVYLQTSEDGMYCVSTSCSDMRESVGLGSH